MLGRQCATSTPPARPTRVPSARRTEACLQEFETGMLTLWGVTPQTKGRRRYVRMIDEWFSQIDADGSGEITFEEFRKWYVRAMSDAQEVGVV